MLRALSLIAPLLLVFGCESPQPRLNAPPHGEAEEVSNLRDLYDHMCDNATLSDMAVNDSHFNPHRASLNSLGESKLVRMAALIEQYGGDVRYNAAMRDDALVDARVRSLVRFLNDHGVAVREDDIVRDLPAGEGMDATQAILIRANEGVYKPKRAGAGAASPAAATSSTGSSGSSGK